MDIKDSNIIYPTDNILLTDSNYYKFIFKKTEKVVCVVFYIINSTNNGHHADTIKTVELSARRALEAVLETLTLRPYGAVRQLYVLINALIALESTLRVAHAAALIEREAIDMVSLEIESIPKSLKIYVGHDRAGVSDGREQGVFMEHKRTAVRVEGGSHREDASSYKGQDTERRSTIKDILSTMGQATIRDISAKIKDCSEKTIQRELISMIKDGVVRKEGERRWSRYALV